MAVILIHNSADFSLRVLHGRGISIACFGASWCDSCRTICQGVERAVADSNNKTQLVFVDVDTHQELADAYHVIAVPTLLFFKDGHLMNRLIGYASDEEIKKCMQHMTTGNS